MEYFSLEPAVDVNGTKVSVLGVTSFSNNDRRAVQAFNVISDEDGGDGQMIEPYDAVAVNLPDQPLPDSGLHTFFARPYDYHLPLYNALLAAEIIEIVPNVEGNAGGWGRVPVARLTAKATAKRLEPTD